MKRLLIIIAIITLSSLVVACVPVEFEYNGDYPDLYSVAINSIPLAQGFEQSEIRFDPIITIMDEDDFGRILFYYTENSPVSTDSMVIMQKSDEEHVFFYPDYNFISSSSNVFSEETIKGLKDMNDWNMEYDETKCVAFPISNKKNASPLTYEDIKPFYEYVFSSDEYFDDDRWIEYFISDQFGRSMYAILARGMGRYAVLMFEPDGTYDIENGYIIFTDFFCYQTALKEFKINNGWNTPLD